MDGGLKKEISFPYSRKPEMTCSGGSQTLILRRAIRCFSQRQKFILHGTHHDQDGGCMQGFKNWGGGCWTKDESKEHINFLELLAALKALQCFTAAVQ